MDRVKISALLEKTIEWSLYLLIFMIPFSKSMIELCITVAFISWIIKKFIEKDFRLKKTPINVFLFAFFIISAISIINADFKMLAMRSLVSKCLKYILLYFIVVETVDTEVKLKRILTMAFISAMIVMMDAYVQYYVTHRDLFRFYPSFKYIFTYYNPGPKEIVYSPTLGFPTGPFPFPNDLSAWMLLILIPLLSVLFWGAIRRTARYALSLFLVPFSFLFYLASTRSAWFAFFVSFFFMLLSQKKIKIIILILLAILIMLPLLPKSKLNDLRGLTSMKDRIDMWRIGWRVFTEHPIIGNGLNMFFSKFKEYREDEFKNKRGSYAHNGYLQMAAEIGAIGLLVFLSLLAKAFYSISRYMRTGGDHRILALGLMGGLLAFLIHSFFDTNLHSLPLVTLFWFSLSFLMALPNLHGQKI